MPSRLRAISTPVMNVVDTAPRPTTSTPSFPLGASAFCVVIISLYMFFIIMIDSKIGNLLTDPGFLGLQFYRDIKVNRLF